jgi:hypothetical protein
MEDKRDRRSTRKVSGGTQQKEKARVSGERQEGEAEDNRYKQLAREAATSQETTVEDFLIAGGKSAKENKRATKATRE